MKSRLASMRGAAAVLLGLVSATAAGYVVAALVAVSPSAGASQVGLSCGAGYVDAIIAGEEKCLRAGEFCSAASETDYERYGFWCVDGHLQTSPPTTTTAPPLPTTTTAPPATTTTAATATTDASTTMPTATTAPTTSVPATTMGTATAPTTSTSLPDLTTPTQAAPTTHQKVRVGIGKTVLLAARTRASRCRHGAEPDRRCSPGAYYSGLTTAVLCSSGFHTGTVRNVQESEKHAVEAEYGMTPRNYGSTLEIDHIISLELGGSNDIGNLFPEQAVIAGGAGYHVKDRLENRLHAMVCAGEITLSAAQRQIATDWEALYARVFGGPALRRLAAQRAVPAR